MSTRRPSRRETLSTEERDLARIVRALPGGEPPAALDALILKAATDAATTSPRAPKNKRSVKAWLGISAFWLGTATASVLTIVLGWQMFQFFQFTKTPIYALSDGQDVVPVPIIDDSYKNNHATGEMLLIPKLLSASPSPALAETESADDEIASSAEPAEEPQAMTSAMPTQKALARQTMADAMPAKKANTDESLQSAQAAGANWVPPTTAVVASVSAPPPMPVSAPPPMPVPVSAPLSMSVPVAAAPANVDERKALETISVTGSRIKRTGATASQPVQVISQANVSTNAKTGIAEDTRLAPAQWLDAVKHRVEQNDIKGAKASLKLYKQTHPKLQIPAELKPLLQ